MLAKTFIIKYNLQMFLIIPFYIFIILWPRTDECEQERTGRTDILIFRIYNKLWFLQDILKHFCRVFLQYYYPYSCMTLNSQKQHGMLLLAITCLKSMRWLENRSSNLIENSPRWADHHTHKYFMWSSLDLLYSSSYLPFSRKASPPKKSFSYFQVLLELKPPFQKNQTFYFKKIPTKIFVVKPYKFHPFFSVWGNWNRDGY